VSFLLILRLGLLAAVGWAQDPSDGPDWTARLIDALVAAPSLDAARAKVAQEGLALGPAEARRLASVDLVLRRLHGQAGPGPALRALLTRALSEHEDERADVLLRMTSLAGQLELVHQGLMPAYRVVEAYSLGLVDTWWYSCSAYGRPRIWSLLDPTVVAVTEPAFRAQEAVHCSADVEASWTLTLGGEPLVTMDQAAETSLGPLTCTPRRLPVATRGRDPWVVVAARPPDCMTREEAAARIPVANAALVEQATGTGG
jgi:hypothetical protein